MNIRLTLKAILAILLIAWFGYEAGYRKAKAEIPSCIYLLRPRGNDVKPWGYDNKEGVDWYCDNIHGGGLYVSLAKWKRGW